MCLSGLSIGQWALHRDKRPVVRTARWVGGGQLGVWRAGTCLITGPRWGADLRCVQIDVASML